MAVLFQNLTRPLHLILHALSRRLDLDAQLQISSSVIATITVLMMNLLIASQRPSDYFSHYFPVLHHEPILSGIRAVRIELIDVPVIIRVPNLGTTVL